MTSPPEITRHKIKYGGKTTTSKFTWVILICALFADMMLGTFFDVISQSSAKPIQLDSSRLQNFLSLFVGLTAVILAAGQYRLVTQIKELSRDVRRKFFSFRALYWAIVIIQFLLMPLFAVLVIQMYVENQYTLVLSLAIIGIGALPGGIMLALLSFKFFTWYSHGIARIKDDHRENRIKENSFTSEKGRKSGRNAIVLLLGLAALMGTIGAILGNITIMATMTTEKPDMVGMAEGSSSNNNYHSDQQRSLLNVLFYSTGLLPLVLSFFFEWGGIVLILRQFARVGFSKRFLFWISVSLPVILFTLGLLPTIIVSPTSNFQYYSTNIVFYRLAATVGAASGYFTMGLGYFLVARSMRKGASENDSSSSSSSMKAVSSYLITSAVGVILISIAFQSPAVNATFPPFGLAAHAFLGTASFVFSLGFYSSAISVSENIQLRREMRKAAIDRTNLLGSIGSAEMATEIQKQVLIIAKKKSDLLAEETAVQPSISVDEMKSYVEQVVNELAASSKSQNHD